MVGLRILAGTGLQPATYCLLPSGMTEWFEEWFGEEYLHLYPHRDEAEAERLVGLLRRTLPWRTDWRVLDVCCGAGRHLRALAAAGCRPIGLDLSRPLLDRAHGLTPVPLIRADIRNLPIRPGTMDFTVNLFTSFGYFETDEEHSAALTGMLQTLKPGGWFALDFLSADYVRRTLVPVEQTTLADIPVSIERRFTDAGRFVVKTIRTPDGREFRERVRLFGPAELEAMLERRSFAVSHRFGDYDGRPLGQGSRTILIGRTR